MAKWKKTLGKLLSDPTPKSYTYSDAISVLQHLGFELAPHGGGSHRKWRKRLPDGNAVIIGLVEHGAGCMKPYLLRGMVAQLAQHGLIPDDLE